MAQNQDNPTVMIALTKGQKRKIKDWSGCVVSTVMVSAYTDWSARSTGPKRDTIPIKLKPDQIQRIEKLFSEHKLTGKEIIVFNPSDDELGEEPITAVAVLKKYIPPPEPTEREDSYSQNCSCTTSDPQDY